MEIMGDDASRLMRLKYKFWAWAYKAIIHMATFLYSLSSL